MHASQGWRGSLICLPTGIPLDRTYYLDACVTGLEWIPVTHKLIKSNHAPFNGADGAKNMAVLARCPRLQTLDFNSQRVDDSSPMGACIGLRRITRICAGDDMTALAALTQLEHLECMCGSPCDV